MWILWALLSTCAWAFVNVVDSVVVHRHDKHPVALMWSQSLVSVPVLILLALTLPLEAEWVFFLIAFGVTAYAADVWFFYVLQHVDVSVSNLAWSILSLLLALIGVLFFGESWSVFQVFGALFIVIGPLFLTFFHHRIADMRRSLLLVLILGFSFVPYYVVKKLAIDHGIDAFSVFFWLLIGREVTSLSVPVLFLPSVRRRAFAAMRKSRWFMIANVLIIFSFFAGEFFGTLAYASGQLSLVSIVSNVQPFMVLGLAWVLAVLLPRSTARELFTRQSVCIKLVAFLIVFVGLALLGVSH